MIALGCSCSFVRSHRNPSASSASHESSSCCLLPHQLVDHRQRLVHAAVGGRLPDLLHGRQQEADQDGDDGDHDEQFNQGKPGVVPGRALVRPAAVNASDLRCVHAHALLVAVLTNPSARDDPSRAPCCADRRHRPEPRLQDPRHAPTPAGLACDCVLLDDATIHLPGPWCRTRGYDAPSRSGYGLRAAGYRSTGYSVARRPDSSGSGRRAN